MSVMLMYWFGMKRGWRWVVGLTAAGVVGVGLVSGVVRGEVAWTEREDGKQDRTELRDSWSVVVVAR